MENKILLIGNYGNYNMGDETLLKVVVLDLLKNEKDVMVSIPVRDPEFINIYHTDIDRHLNPFYVYDFKTFAKCLFDSKKIIVGGGGIWSGYTGRLAKMIPIFLIISKILRKKVIVRSVGLYDTASKTEKILVNLSFMLADRCSVRDVESFKNIWSINKKIIIDNDLAFELPNIIKNGLYQKYDNLLKRTLEYNILKDIKNNNKFIIGISIKPLKDKNKTIEITEKIAKFIDIINSQYENKIHFVFFPFAKTSLDIGVEDDTIVINDIINKVKFKENVTIISHMNPILWYLLIEFIDIFIGMRFHSIIFAFVNNKPLLAIPYENKVWNFIEDKNCKNVLTLENFDEKYLMKFFEENYNSNNRR